MEMGCRLQLRKSVQKGEFWIRKSDLKIFIEKGQFLFYFIFILFNAHYLCLANFKWRRIIEIE